MPLMSLKEISMLALGMLLVYTLFYLRTHEQLFPAASSLNDTRTEITATPVEVQPEQPDTLPQAILEKVEIPDWLANKDDYQLSDLTTDDLVNLAQLAHSQGHDFFPDNQNTLVYLLHAQELGLESQELDELMTTIHASLYTEADLAINAYDAEKLTALTARLKSIDPNDPKITAYTNQISVIYTLERLLEEIHTHVLNDQLYNSNQQDAVHNLLKAAEIDPQYPPLIEQKLLVLEILQNRALRAAQEQDFTMADAFVAIMQELDQNHPLSLQTIVDINGQKQDRFAYLDQQFYAAIDDLNLNRARLMLTELQQMDISDNQINGYESLLNQTRLYGRYEVSDEFNDLLRNGRAGPLMVVLPTVDFYMGSQTGPKHQRPRHLVEIDYGYAVSKNEITVGQFAQFIEATGYQTTAEANNRAKIYNEGTGRFKQKFNTNWRHDYLGKPADPDLPVIHVSWQDANAYVNWLATNTQQPYRLPSEAEFEFILGNGQNNRYPWGDDQPEQIWGNFSGAMDKFKRSRIRWREGFSNYTDGHWGPAPVGSFISNLLGLNDLSGNVMEWVDDCWHDSYVRAPGDGSSWVNRGCESRVIRGGSWGSAIEEYEIHHRLKADVDFTDPRLGFRVARSLVLN